MVETGHHHHHPPPPQAVPPPPVMPLGAARGPVYPPAEQLLHLHYCIHSNPSWVQTVLLAFQHYVVMLGTTVMIVNTLVPQMGGGAGDRARVIQGLLFTSGVNTLLQTLLGTRLPTVMGPSFAYLISALLVINDLSDDTFPSEHERFLHTMRAIQGSLIVSSFINIILGYGKVWGNLTRFFSPVVIAPLVIVLGLGLFSRGFPQLADCVEIGLPMLILLVVCQQYLQHVVHHHQLARSILERFALLFCVGLVWAFAAILTVAGAYNHVRERTELSCRTDRANLISSAPWIKIPYPFQWGTPIFRASHVFGMMGAALVTSSESITTFYAASRLAGATAPPAFVISRSIGLQGIGQLIDGFFGGVVGTAASVENVGLLGLTRVGSRRVVEISSAFMLFFSIFGKFGAFFASIPLPIFAAIYCILYGIVAAVGVSYIQFANNNSMRNIYVLGVSLFLGISIPQYFVMNTDISGHGPVKTQAGWFNGILNTIFSSPPTVAMIVGTILDNTLEARNTVEDRGLPWFVPFHRRKGDSRSSHPASAINLHLICQAEQRAMASLSWWRATPSAAVPTATKAVYLPPPPSKATNWASFRGNEYEKLVAKARGGLINSPRKMNGNSVRCQAAEQKMTHEGSITESLPNGMFRVRLDNEDVILGYISGKIRKNFIRLLPGDRVRVEVSRYDSSRGRIIFRLRGKDPN